MGDGEPRRSRWRHLLTPAIAAVALGAVWWLVGVLFSNDRGLDLHDEGLYLLAAEHGNLRGTWTTPFGWHTRPFFLLLGESVVRLRTFAVVALVLVGAGLGWAIGRVTAPGEARDDRVTRGLLAAVGAFGGPMLTASMLRTPGYNWVNLVGLTIAATGLVLGLRVPQAEPDARAPRAIGAAATIAVGALFATPGKPTSTIAVAVVGVLFLWTRHGRRRVAVLGAIASVTGVVLVGLSVVARIWPTDFLGVLRTGASVPPLHENQTIGGALRDVLRTPKVAVQDLGRLRVATFALVLLAALSAWRAPHLAARATPLRPWPARLRIAPLALAALAAVSTAAPLPVLGGDKPEYRFAWFGTTNAAVLLLVAGGLHVWAHRDLVARDRLAMALRVAAMLLLLTVAFGFGSAMSVYHQAALAAVLLWSAAAALVVAVDEGRARAIATGIVTVAALVMFATNLADSRAHPFMFTEIGTQTTRVPIGPHGEHLLLDDFDAEYLFRLERAAADGGFCPGTPLLGFQWQWSATEQYALAATVPDMLLLTIFGYPDPYTALDHSLATLDPARWSDAWVITTDPTTLAADQAAQPRTALDRLPEALGRTFPADYRLAATAGGTQLWRPADVPVAGCG